MGKTSETVTKLKIYLVLQATVFFFVVFVVVFVWFFFEGGHLNNFFQAISFMAENYQLD